MEDIQHKGKEDWRIYSTQTVKSGGYTASKQGRVEDIQHTDKEEGWDVQHVDKEEWRIYSKDIEYQCTF